MHTWTESEWNRKLINTGWATSKNVEPDYFFKLEKFADATKLTKLYSQILHFYAISKLPEIFFPSLAHPGGPLLSLCNINHAPSWFSTLPACSF